MNPRYTFDFAFRILLAVLPFMTLLSIFTKERLGIPGFAFLKEWLLFLMLLTLAWYHVLRKKRIVFTFLDGIIWAYIILLLLISIKTTGISGIIYGWRYDFSFLIAFFTIIHWVSFLEKPISYYIKIFIISGGIMIFLSMLLKWPLSEDILLYFGYSWNPSNWQFWSSIPIFHGVDGANIRRFQWLLDGPNTMGAFLLLYTAMFTHYFRHYKKWHFFIGCVVSGFFLLVIYTYSRSALLWFFSWLGIIILFLLPKIYNKYRLQFFTIVGLLVLILWAFFIQYSWTMKALMGRAWSTSWHLERMKIWISRFQEHPLWQGLWSAWPAYRYVQKLENTDRKEIEEIDKKYIPESWYIQQLVEGWILGFVLFIGIVGSIFWRLKERNIIVAWWFASILVMNLFLHTFESAIVSLLLFLLVGLILAPHEKSR